eukprot:gene11000-14774_t
MGPCVVDSNNVDGKKAINALQLNNIKKALPEEVFKKSIIKSLFYMFFDYFMWFGSTLCMLALCRSEVWIATPLWAKVILSLMYWNFAGFFMWSIFIIGHDCGHTTFSDSELLNDIIGHVTHGSILVPFYPWQLSHRRHHMYHNHVEMDYSHPWLTPEKLAKPDAGLNRLIVNSGLLRLVVPYFGWYLYLYGFPDGSHWYPFTQDRLWVDTPVNERSKCILSNAIVIAYLIGAFFLFDCNITSFIYYYGMPHVIFGWWLFTVTYLQHHNPDTLVYDDSNWKFVDSAFETVDRTFGYGLDTLHHHITDGHVAHHLFFTKIPHYNLPLATKAIKTYMEENDLGWMYKNDKTYDFPYRMHKYFYLYGYKSLSTTASDSPATNPTIKKQK